MDAMKPIRLLTGDYYRSGSDPCSRVDECGLPVEPTDCHEPLYDVAIPQWSAANFTYDGSLCANHRHAVFEFDGEVIDREWMRANLRWFMHRTNIKTVTGLSNGRYVTETNYFSPSLEPRESGNHLRYTTHDIASTRYYPFDSLHQFRYERWSDRMIVVANPHKYGASFVIEALPLTSYAETFIVDQLTDPEYPLWMR